MKKFILEKVLPVHTKRRQAAVRLKHVITKKVGSNTTAKLSYANWIRRYEPLAYRDTLSTLKTATYKPLISIIVPCYNTPQKYFEPLLQSVIDQHYDNWELCLVDGSTEAQNSEYLHARSQLDQRITYVRVGKNLGIVGNTNIGLDSAKGEFVAFLDHDDVLSKYALAEVINRLNKVPDSDLIYSDEDKLTDDGKHRVIPFFKPDWSPDLLLGINYITHFVVARKKLVQSIGGLRAGFDGAQDYDFLLRLTEQTNRIQHIPKILYHWRLAQGSTANTVGEKNYADAAGFHALQDVLKRRKIKGKVAAVPGQPTNNRIRYALPKKVPKVSIIIPFKDKADLLKQCVGSILEKTTYENYEIILVSNNSTEKATHDYLASLKNNKRCKTFYWDHPFNYSKVNNFGRTKATGDYIVLLNNDTEVITPDWLEEMIGVASQPGVGPLLYYPDRTIQHAGVILGMNTMAGHVFRHHVPLSWTEFGMPAWPRNYIAVTAACLAVAADKYDEVGGLDETFTVAGNDVAFCIRLYEKGYRNVYWPFAQLIHYESVSVGSYDTGIQLDYDHSLTYYAPYLKWKDPYFNLNLDLMNEQVGLRSNYE